jgi:hypothetical protein
LTNPPEGRLELLIKYIEVLLDAIKTKIKFKRT